MIHYYVMRIHFFSLPEGFLFLSMKYDFSRQNAILSEFNLGNKNPITHVSNLNSCC